MKALALLAVLAVGSTVAAPSNLDGLGHHHHHHDHPQDPLLALPSALSPAFVGYNYEPPAQPSGLYEFPVGPSDIVEVTPPPATTTTTTTNTTTTTPPPPPPGLYLPPPDKEPAAANEIINVIEPSGSTTTMMPMPYNINWGVSDPESGNIFNHIEDSDGREVTGEYSVLLPDSRMQIVRFRVDPVNGYQAEVTYELVK